MKKILLISFLPAIFALWTFTSCSGDGQTEEPEVEVSKVSNPNNPYDYIGALHNKALTMAIQMGSTKGFTGKNAIENALIASEEVLAQYETTKSYELDLTDQEIEELERLFNLMINDINNGLENYINSLDISSSVKSYMISIFRDVANLNDPVPESIINNVLDFENKIIFEEPLLTPDDQAAILSTTATLRYSCDFWNNELAVTRAKLRWWQYLVVIVSDAGGALAGSAGGAATAVSVGVAASNFANTVMKDLNTEEK